MKYASIKVLVLVLASGGSIAACASGTDSLDFDSGAGGGVTSTGTTPGVTSGGGNGGNGGAGSDATSSSSGGSTVDAGSCVPQCSADTDCQVTCPAAQTGINCCDTATGTCYVAATPICPMPQPDGGTVTPPY